MKLYASSSYRLVLAGLAWLGLALGVAHAQTSLPHAQVGQNFSFQVSTTPSAPSGTLYSASGLPTGISINAASGLISGTPTTAGTSTGTLRLDYPSGLADQFDYSLVVDPAAGTPVITSASTATGTVGQSFTVYAVTASPTATSFNIGTLPSGLAVGGTVAAPTITGTPTIAGTYQVTLSANNSSGTGATATLTITIAPAGAVPAVTSAATASGPLNAAFTYTITGSNTPTSFSASGLPVGLSLDTVSGVISGTPAVAGIYTVALTASNANGTGAAANLVLTIGDLPSITSSLTASGTAGSPFLYRITASNSATSFNVGTLPAGLSVDATTGMISGTPTATSTTSVTLSANNALGTGATSTFVITISPAPSGGGNVVPPTITSQPASQTATVGGTVTFKVTATNAVGYQWRKNGSVISGATGSSFILGKVSLADAGNYSVSVSGDSVSISSNVAVLTVQQAVVSPTITGHPESQTAFIGGTVTLSATATGTGLTYQWRKDGTAIAGATDAALTLSGITGGSAGDYSVVVSNSAGSSTSNTATITIRGAAHIGTLSGNGGTFALYIRPDNTGVFLAYASATQTVLASTDVAVDANGHFSLTVDALAGGLESVPTAVMRDRSVESVAADGDGGPPVTSIDPTIIVAPLPCTIDGSVAADGTVSGTISPLGLTMSAPAAASGAETDISGFYQAGETGGSATTYVIVGGNGDAFVVAAHGGTAVAGEGSVDASGNISVTTNDKGDVTGSIDTSDTISLTVAPASGSSIACRGANNDARSDVEKLVNISSRSQAGSNSSSLIAGFVISGTQPKEVLLRAIGPSLAQFGVAHPLPAARVELFSGVTSLQAGTDWSLGPDPAGVAAAAARVGAFGLADGSHDAAILVTLNPGAYSAVVSGQNGATGVALVEVYDATNGPIPRDQRIINISTRSLAGSGENVLTAGFVINGSVPKRVLVRAVGPSLAQFQVSNALAKPQIKVLSGSTVVVQNAGWGTSSDASAIAAAAAQTGAFPLLSGSQDSAVLVYLAPGQYTAQVSSTDGATGVALVEVYEVP